MKFRLFVISIAVFSQLVLFGQSSTSTLDVVSWNLEFFGAPFASGPADKDLQESNAKKILRYFDADIYGLVEIVDTTHLRKLRDSLGTNYEFIVAPYSSSGNIGSNGWRQAQKLAFLYKKDIFSNISTRGMMLTSPTAVSNWATGRVPFLFKADATINGITKTLHFIVIHGKAGNTSTDYDRRLAGARELKDTLDAQFSTANTFIIGDYNDALNTTISTGSGSLSSYQPIVVDSTDADHYKSITMPLANAGQTSMINFPNVVDNHVVSNEVSPLYILNSVKIRTDVTAVVPDYVTAHNTSDHYPVFSQYSLAGIVTGIPTVSTQEFGIQVFPNPYSSMIYIRAIKTIPSLSITLTNIQGQMIRRQTFGMITAGSSVQPSFGSLAKGVYLLTAASKELKTTIKLTVL